MTCLALGLAAAGAFGVWSRARLAFLARSGGSAWRLVSQRRERLAFGPAAVGAFGVLGPQGLGNLAQALAWVACTQPS
jgi:hypothetical protein